eukprot:482037-Alexandrium_andersonii.AAC.1
MSQDARCTAASTGCQEPSDHARVPLRRVVVLLRCRRRARQTASSGLPRKPASDEDDRGSEQVIG